MHSAFGDEDWDQIADPEKKELVKSVKGGLACFCMVIAGAA